MIKDIPMNCEQATIEWKDNGGQRTVRLYSYVALFCEIGGNEVKAVRYDYIRSKNELHPKLDGYRLKGVWKLYDTDFSEVTP